MCASLKGVVKPAGAMKVKVVVGCPRREALLRWGCTAVPSMEPRLLGGE